MNVVFLIFNRPDLTARVFAEIAKARPSKLFVVADGPRSASEQQRCMDARAVIDGVDWECAVHKNYADQNMGCKRRVSSGLDWVFEQVEEAIILEDDCLPHATFFRYCTELLERYRNDERVMHIAGHNFRRKARETAYNYCFSKYPVIWGWATWRRAWQYYDVAMHDWTSLRETDFLQRICPDSKEYAYWRAMFDVTHDGEMDTWDFQWYLTCWKRKGVAVMPSVNLVSNLGFGPGATHTPKTTSWSALPLEPMVFPMSHPSKVSIDNGNDRFLRRKVAPSLPVSRHLRRLKNRHFWGSMFRRVPLVGPMWAKWRTGLQPSSSLSKS